MLTLLSPAKKLLNFDKPFNGQMHRPLFLTQAEELVRLMRQKSIEDLASLMDLSRDLASLNYERFKMFHLEPSAFLESSYPAILLFQGDVYQGLQAAKWDQLTLNFSQSHLGILSGLYGYLNPLDGIQPYRLEMGVKLNNSKGVSLYDFWREGIALLINEKLSKQTNPILINLASNEYFKAVNTNAILYPIVTINFYEKKNNELKMVGILSKKARGTMAKFIMEHQIDDLEGVKQFKELGYGYHAESSNETTFNFIR